MAVTPILLDTSAYSFLMRGNGSVLEYVTRAGIVYMSVVVLGELRTGFIKGSQRVRNESILQDFLSEPSVEVVGISSKTTLIYADIINELSQKGKPIPTNDIWIAAQGIEAQATLLTADSHFQKISHLRVEHITTTKAVHR